MTGQLTLTDEQVAVMRKTLEHVLGNPDEWNQRYWSSATTASCGTAYCFAGHAAVTIAGGRPTYTGSTMVELDEFEHHISDAAQRLLGLDDVRAGELFRATNSARRLAELCYLYSDGQVDLLHAVPPPTDADVTREGAQSDDAFAAWATIRDQARYLGVDLVTLANQSYRASS